VRPIRRVLVWGRNHDKARAVAQSAKSPQVDAQAVTDLRSALAQADIISCATLATEPLIMGSLLKPGTHVDLVGAFRPNMCEADPTCFARSRVFVDIREGALEEAGDLMQAIEADAMKAQDIEAELEELCCGQHPGRGAHPDDITVFKSVGSAIEDLAAAELVFRSWSQPAD
jgi:ornithine cyclodeaminase